jgi:hypothetical protein
MFMILAVDFVVFCESSLRWKARNVTARFPRATESQGPSHDRPAQRRHVCHHCDGSANETRCDTKAVEVIITC